MYQKLHAGDEENCKHKRLVWRIWHMNKNAIKKFAIDARNKLIASVTDKAGIAFLYML